MDLGANKSYGRTLTKPGSYSDLREIGLVHETTRRQRDRLFAYQRYLAVLSEGTEPL
jgi:hypothetical protein